MSASCEDAGGITSGLLIDQVPGILDNDWSIVYSSDDEIGL